MIDRRLAYISAIAFAAAGATSLVMMPQDSISLALGMGRSALAPDQKIDVPVLSKGDVAAGIGGGWFDPRRCRQASNGMIRMEIGGRPFSVSPYDVAQIDLAWDETWTQSHDGPVVLHRESGCPERPLVARSLRTVAQGSFNEGVMVWPTKTTKREYNDYVERLDSIRVAENCYTERDVRICRDPDAKPTETGGGFYAFPEAPAFSSGAPVNVRCHAAGGHLDRNRPEPLRDVSCQIADLSPDGYVFSAVVRNGTMFDQYQAKQWIKESQQSLKNITARP